MKRSANTMVGANILPKIIRRKWKRNEANSVARWENSISNLPINLRQRQRNAIRQKTDNVFVTTLNLKGTITSLPNAKGDLYVQMGILKSVVNIKNLEILEQEKPKQQQPSPGYKANFMKSATISPEINLLGKTVDEALMELDKYLDDAYLSKLTQVTIIHGKGTGALRSAVQTYLKKQKHIKSFRSGVYGEGEAGVTIVEF